MARIVDECDACEGKGWFVAYPDGDDSEEWIERCDQCVIFGGDDAAAIAAAQTTGAAIAWRPAEGALFNERPRPYFVNGEREAEVIA